MADEKRSALVECRLEIGSIIRSAHAEIGKVVQVLPEQFVTIARVGPCVKNVGVPEFIDWTRGTDLPISVHDVQSEEAAIQILDVVLVLRRPTLFLAKLPLEHAEIQTLDLFESRRDPRVVFQEALALFPIEGLSGTGIIHDSSLLFSGTKDLNSQHLTV